MTESFFRNESQPADGPGASGEFDGEAKEATRGSGAKFDSGEFATEEGRMGAILAYVPILCFIPLLNMRENKEARFHARQGVMLFLVELVALLFLIDGVSAFVFRVVLVLAVGLAVAGVILSLQGRSYRLPVLGDLADKVKL